MPSTASRACLTGLLVGWVSAGGFGCASTQLAAPSPSQVTTTAARLSLEEARTAPLRPVAVGEVLALLQQLDSPDVDGDLRRELTTGDVVKLRLVRTGADHPAYDVLLSRARRLVGDEGVAPERFQEARAVKTRARVAALREQLAATTTTEAAHAVRGALARAAVESEILGWQLAYRVGLELGGPIFEGAIRSSYTAELLADPVGTLAELTPRDPDYAALQAALKTLRAAASGPDGELRLSRDRRWLRLRPGKRGGMVKLLRDRLAAEGLSGKAAGSPEVYDAQLMETVAAFQRRHGLHDHGRIDPMTLRALSVSVADRAQQVVAALRHRRSSKARRYAYRIEVNIPAFELRVFRERELVRRHRVVVGSAKRAWDAARRRAGALNQTPVLESRIGSLVLNPSWRIPRRIKEQELDPRAEASPGFYDRYRLYTDSRGVEWAVQPPGPGNALGRVKFLFPGGDGVYLHDTPKKKDFGKSYRALSHGCVRVDDALSLAKNLLEYDGNRTTWDRARRVLRSRRETPVTLNSGVPLTIEYVTVTTDGEGRLRFHDDVYGWGAIVAAEGDR